MSLGKWYGNLVNIKMNRYSRKGLSSLFLMCAFPLHVWTFLLVFMDISWLTERTNIWDAVGVAAYGTVFTLVESVIVFIALVLFGFLIPIKWSEERRIALLTVFIFATALWAMNGQAYFIWDRYISETMFQYIVGLKHPFRFLYGGTLAMVLPSVAIPAYMVLISDRFLNWIQNIMSQLSLLTVFYLFIDFIGLLIVLFRNIL